MDDTVRWAAGAPRAQVPSASPACDDAQGVAQALRALVADGADGLPLPGQGRTLQRWQVLAAVAQRDLSLAKLFEGHTDALAILHEVHAPGLADPGLLWGTWCAEPPDARLAFSPPDRTGGVRLHGRKAWCSGAWDVDHAVVSGWNADGEPCLAAVAMRQPGVQVTDDGWHATGMRDTRSVDVAFDGAPAQMLGLPHAYVRRPGFWHGGAGIAACWWGGAAGLGLAAHAAIAQRGEGADPHALAHLGQIDVALRSSAALLREAAEWIDRHPTQDAQALALRVRLAVERDATQVLHHAGRALGAAAPCRDAAVGRAMADLPVYLRQSHAERDLAALGARLAAEKKPWTL